MSFPDWGDVPTWLAAIAAVAAFVGAVKAYQTQAASFRDQAKANKAQTDEIHASLKRNASAFKAKRLRAGSVLSRAA
jgi:hypothetical protein